MTDQELLQAYLQNHSEDAFRALIERYIRLVYGACERQLHDRQLAEDATQGVFVLLSQKASGIRQTHVAGWLLSVARFACADVRRERMRRERRERAVAHGSEGVMDAQHTEMAELLDAGLLQLNASDRDAVVRRFLREQSLREVGTALGVSEDAARKRVDRGIEKLRKYFTGKGIAAGSAAVTSLLAAESRRALATEAQQVMTQGIIEACRQGAAGQLAAAEIAKGTQMLMRMAQVKFATAVMLAIVLSISLAGWIVARALATAPLPAGAVAVAAPMPPATTTAPAVNLSSPVKTIESFINALRDGDQQRTYACLAVDPNRDPTEVDADFMLSLAENRLANAAVRVFGPRGKSLKAGFVTADQIADTIIAAAGGLDQVLQVKENGATARATLVLPPDILPLIPQEERADFANAERKPLWFKRIGGEWRFDIDRSVKAELIGIGVRGGNPDEARHRGKAATLDLVNGLDEVTRQIGAGELKTLGEARSAMNLAWSEAMQAHGIQGLNADATLAEEAP